MPAGEFIKIAKDKDSNDKKKVVFKLYDNIYEGKEENKTKKSQ